VELLAKQIEEKEKLNRSIDSEVISLNKSIGDEMVKETVNEKATTTVNHVVDTQVDDIAENNQEILGEISEHKSLLDEVKEDLIQSTKEDSFEVENVIKDQEVKGLLEVKDILEASNDQDALDETLPSSARLETIAVNQFAEDNNTEEEVKETKDQIEEVGMVKVVNEIEAAIMEPSSLESVDTDEDDDDNTKIVENGNEVVENSAGNVIDTIVDSSEEGGASTDEGYDDEKSGGAKGLRKALKNADNAEVDDCDQSERVESN